MTQEDENKLREQLDLLHNWPEEYLFKFILPEDEDKKRAFESIFTEKARIKSRLSSKGNYSAYSIKLKANSTDEVLRVYKEASKISGLITL